jgi:hypothetical protein
MYQKFKSTTEPPKMKPTQLVAASLNTIFHDICKSKLSEEECSLYVLIINSNSFEAAITSHNQKNRHHESEDARGFGEGLPNLPIDLFIDFLKITGIAILSDITKDAAQEIIYSQLLEAIKKIPAEKAIKYEPWHTHIKTYLSSKISRS